MGVEFAFAKANNYQKPEFLMFSGASKIGTVLEQKIFLTILNTNWHSAIKIEFSLAIP